MTSAQVAEANYMGDLANLDSDDRLMVPADLRKILPWLGGKKPVPLLAELREKGRVRFHPLDQAAHRLAALRSRIVESHPNKAEALGVLSDRYREVKYYPSDTRVHLPPTILTYLEARSAGGSTFYVEIRGDHFDAMTLAMRDERLRRSLGDLELPRAPAESSE
jgi:hypothetical protein